MTTGDPGDPGGGHQHGHRPTTRCWPLPFPKGQRARRAVPAPVEMLSAYATQPQAGAGQTPLVLDRTALSYGTAAAHQDNTAPVTLQEPGVYTLAFQGSFSPGSGATFPLNVGVYPQVNGTELPGGLGPAHLPVRQRRGQPGLCVPLPGGRRPRHPGGGGHRERLRLQQHPAHGDQERGPARRGLTSQGRGKTPPFT